VRQAAIVTGGGSGIGQALAWELALTHNFKVYIVGRRADTLAQTLNRAQQNIVPVTADVATAAGRRAILRAVSAETTLKFLVHNAALLQPVKPLMSVTVDEWRYHQATNVEGPLFLTQALLPKLSGGRVLHISSGAAHHAYAGWGAYCASKAALHMIYQVLRLELKKQQVSVGSLRPGVVDTPMQNSVRQADAAVFPRLQRFVELKKNNELLSPAFVARFIAYVLLETDDERYSRQEWDIREQMDLAQSL